MCDYVAESDGVMEQPRSTPLAFEAHIAGLCYLLVIAGGVFAEVVVREALVVPGDAAATAQAIAVNDGLWRWGLGVHLLYLVAAVVVDVLLYGLFQRVQATLARVALVLAVTSVTIEAVSLLNVYVPLAIINESDALAGLGEAQRHALVYLATNVFSTGFAFSLLFFAGFCVLTGVLIRRSRLLPHVIGALMIAAGVCYFVNSLVFVLAPDASTRLVPWILLPAFVGELSLALWLAVKGARVDAPNAVGPFAVRG